MPRTAKQETTKSNGHAAAAIAAARKQERTNAARIKQAVSDAARPVTMDMDFNEQIKRLNALIQTKPETSRILEVGPELAEYILTTRNVSNRPMKSGKIKTYAADLSHGRWGLTGDTLKFGQDGTLKDGQNRLAAVVRSRTPLVTHAVFGVEPDLFSRMDIGKNRTPADVFHIAGLHYANHAAAAVRWLMILTSDNPGNRSAHFTNEQLLEAYRHRFDPLQIENSVKIALEVKKGTGAPVGSVAALHYLFAEHDETKATDFMMQWANGEGGRNHPPKVLQQRLQEIALATNNRVHETVRNALIVQAFLAFDAGKSLKKSELVFDPSEDHFPRTGILEAAE